MNLFVEDAIDSLSLELGALEVSTPKFGKIHNAQSAKERADTSCDCLTGEDQPILLGNAQLTVQPAEFTSRWSRKSISGTAGNDRLIGTNFSDELVGHKGNDLLMGGKGNDSLYGDKGNDTLQGGHGNDNMWGASGNNVLTGGKGQDTFGLTAGKGIDIVKDYKDGEDFIGITNGTFWGTGTTLDKVGLSQSGSAVIIWYENDLMAKIANAKVSQFDTSDFIVSGN